MFDVSISLRPFQRLLLGLFLSCIAIAGAQAQESSSDFKVTGFLSVVGGKVVQSNFDTDYAGPTTIYKYDCPCYIADWGNAGLYTKSASFKAESRVGVQLTYKPSTSTSFIGQVVSRGTDSKPNVQWAYGGYKLNSNWEVQLGRKRIPLYYYSDFQDIGLSYPWVTPPPELYGWEATNYNGGSVRYNGNIGEANITSSVFTGSEKVKDSLYQLLYYSGKNEVTWKNIKGGDLEVNFDTLTLRGIYMKADVRSIMYAHDIDDSAKLKAFGVAANLDLGDWFILGEMTQLSRYFVASDYTVTAPAMTIGAGRRMGSWTVFGNYAQYVESSTNHEIYIPQKFKRTSLTVRYDLDSSSAIKAQLDRNKDTSNNFGGNTTVFRLSYDRVF